MSDGEGGGSPIAATYTAANASLRDAAKWLVGGVVGTSAGVFAGSSLTELGSLDFYTYPGRLSLAICGGAVGFAALGFILARATAVLMVETLSMEDITRTKGQVGREQKGQEKTRKDQKRKEMMITHVYDQLQKHYHDKLVVEQHDDGKLQLQTLTLAAYVQLGNEKWSKRDRADLPFVKEYLAWERDVLPQASLLYLRERFGRLIAALWIGGPLAVLGFGLFAWAANPPDEKPPTKPPLLIINQP